MSCTQSRSHRSLLTGPWHTSSRVVSVLMLLFLVFCNVPGQHVKQIWYEIGHPFYVISQFEHGWPLTYLVRAVPYPEFPSPSIVVLSPDITIRGCFTLWDDVEDIRLGMLLANGCVILLASLACGVLFEAWRRARRRIWHIHLRDLFAATLAVSLVAAWYVYEKRRFNAENAILFGSNGDSGHAFSQWYQEGGTTWLRLSLGDKSSQFLDRSFGVTVEDSEGWFQLERLTSVRHVHTRRRATTDELANLARMPKMEALYLDDDLELPDDDVVAELPPLPRLRGLFLCQPAHRCRRIDRLSSLEAIRVTEGNIDDQLLREIGTLRNLRQLALDGLAESADLSFLPSLSKLTAVDFYHSSLSGAALRNIGNCLTLREVSFYMAEVDGENILHLSNLTNLENLDLNYTEVTSHDVAPLGVLKRLRNVNLNATEVDDLSFVSKLDNLETLSLYNTKVTGEDLAPLVGLKKLHSLDLGYAPVGRGGLVYLRQMKQLQWLRISRVGRDEEKAFQEALPECEIIFH